MSEASLITPEEFTALVQATIPISEYFHFEVERFAFGEAVLRMPFSDRMLRAGGTIAGPTLMTLADTALYAAVLTTLGIEAMAVTADLNFHFLRRPPQEDLLCEARVVKRGRRLVVGEIHIFSAGDPLPVVLATGAYSLPRG